MPKTKGIAYGIYIKKLPVPIYKPVNPCFLYKIYTQ
jgi:hypothetical protein